MRPLTPLLRDLPLLPCSAVVLLTLMVGAPQAAEAQSCTVDPYGAEVCLPEEDEEKRKKKKRKNNTMVKEKKGKGNFDRMVVIPDCFGPCKEFPPAPPYRQFEEAAAPEPEPAPEPMPEPQPEPEPMPEPIRPLWFKSDALDHATAEAYLERTLRHVELAQASSSTLNSAAAPIVRVDGMRYVEVLEPNTVLISRTVNEPGINVWVRGFGGSTPNGAGSGRYADIDNGGAQLGFDIPLSNTTRIGLFGTYSVMDGEDGSRGSWDADGWGGGGYAEYWTSNFYLRGMISAGGYDGDQRRKVNGNNTASGNRSGNSWTGVVSLGAPFDSGDWILEPQALVSYTNTSLDRFSEGGVKRSQRLQYHEMEIDSVDTELSMKFTYPIRDGQRSLFMPSLRLGWAADWGNTGDSQQVSFIESGNSTRMGINGDADHGALIELGLDYTSFNFNDTSMGVYARTGVVLWGGDRGTSWQVQGGLNFRF